MTSPLHPLSTRASAACAALSLASFVALSACSSSTTSGGPDIQSDASFDAPSDAPKPDSGPLMDDEDAPGPDASPPDAADGGCELPVWATGDIGVSYSSSGGLTGPSPACTAGFAFTFSASASTLDVSRCNGQAASHVSVALTSAEVTQLETALQGLKTSCDRTGCGADYPNETLIVHESAVVAHTYSGDFYAGCSGTPPQPPPYIHYMELNQLGSAVNTIVQADCGDGGTSRCTSLPIDGGTPDDAGPPVDGSSGD